ncbi:MAG: hypothetical protein AAF656_07230, partial [Planctomycetota bacterium]
MSCAEPSADRYLADLASVLAVPCSGIGGAKLGEHAEVWADSVSNARMGLAAFLRTREIAKLLAEQKRRWAENKPAC